MRASILADNIGDVCGGILFSFGLVFWVNPLTALCLAYLPLLASSYLLFAPSHRNHPGVIAAVVCVAVFLGAGIGLEKWSLAPAEGKMVFYRDTPYGRIAVHQDREQFTLFESGVPTFSNQNLSIAEETIHYPLSQLDVVEHVLLISAEGGVMAELEKYPIQSVDYVELDPEVAAVKFRFDLIKKIRGLNIIHEDGRAYLSQSKKNYDAILVNLPEPDTFQLNRFYTDVFFNMASNHLVEEGVLSFSMEGFDTYLAEPQRQKLSSLYNTAGTHFKHVLLLPGQKVFFLCSDSSLITDIPTALKQKHISHRIYQRFFLRQSVARENPALEHAFGPFYPSQCRSFTLFDALDVLPVVCEISNISGGFFSRDRHSFRHIPVSCFQRGVCSVLDREYDHGQ